MSLTASASPPLRLSAIIGDCVTNLRAALDYIVWELAQRYFVPPFDIRNRNDRRIASFTIAESPTDAALENRINSLANRKVPADSITEIQGAQPYNRGYESLLWLSELVNRDKHRMPLLTIAEFDHLTVTLGVSPLYAHLMPNPPILRLPRHLATGDAPRLHSDMQMKGEVALYVTWKDVPVPREPVDRTLEQIIEAVTNVIPRFDRFFA